MAALESLAMIGRIEDTLVITYDGGRLQFIQEPPPPVTELTGTKWQLTEMVMDDQIHQILEGTNEIMRVIIARRLLMEGALEVIQ